MQLAAVEQTGEVQSSRSSWEFEEGDEIAPGRYAVRLLGGGRRYEAYLAWDETLAALVVIKVVRPARLEDPGTLAGIVGEVRALSALNHPAIVRSFEAQLDGERPHVVLEYLDGPRLSTLIRRFGVIVEQLLPLALELCSALHYMSAQRIVHLDVKPRNVIMSAPPRLVDLSVAISLDDLGSIRSPIGTDAYMSPEQCDPDRFDEISPASDVWGLGVTLYEALTRSLPFPAPGDFGSASSRYPQLVAEAKPLPKQIPTQIAAPILACLEKDPANRPTARELAATLEPFVAALPRPRLGQFRPGGRTRRSDFQID